MAMFIVSYRRDADGVCCTNIAVAENREQVEAEYGECDFIAINPAKVHEVEALRRRGCPVVECKDRHDMVVTPEQVAKALRVLDVALAGEEAMLDGGDERGAEMYSNEALGIARVLDALGIEHRPLW